ncbi:hypothetical protein JCM19275_884 [Nonlabens ulvanivorans]|uniref:Outer membrane protein beta-barrel domain-containing protein n=1 Tax=Nonlabens ulvanivorans TaxID=906888 RepID=A0A090WCU9_NONUL|nr:porin family protein [Nonlabens ulvanivorans]GAL74845.1 hypothetical protein JCM19275_884 [Nonlabens ulvanivorans]
MKKLLLTLITCVSLSLTGQAQEKGLIEVMGSAGLNISNVSNAFDNTKSDFNFNAAVGAEYYFSDRWGGIKAKIILDQKGWADGFVSDEFGTLITDFRLSYTTIPVTGVLHFGRSDNWYLHFGGYVGFLNDATALANDSDVSEAFSSTDFGFNTGIGVRIPISDQAKIFFEYDAQSGLNDVFKENNGEAARNGRSSINAGIVFSL